ncbi:50S ribosomal protein L30 [bacterium]|nr:50S ribosomal protein L30 [bacterium]
MNNKRSGVNIRITLIKGLAGKKERHRGTIKALGLKRIGSSVIKEDNLQIRGMIARVSYMVKVNGVKPVKSTKGK